MKTRILSLGGLFIFLPLSSSYFAAPAPAPETPKLRATLVGHKKNVFLIAISPDGKTLASGCDDGTVKLWNVANGKEVTTLMAHTERVHGLAFSPDSKVLASADDHTIHLWNLTNDKYSVRETFKTASGPLLFSPDGKTLVSVPRGVRLWDLEKKQSREALKLSNGILLHGMLYTSEAKLLVAASDGHGGADLYDVLEGKKIRTLEIGGGGIQRVRFSADGQTIVTVDFGIIRLWEVATGKEKVKLKVNDDIECFAFNPKGTILAVGRRPRGKLVGTISLHDAATGQELTVLESAAASAYLVFSPDGKTLASCASDMTIKLWSIPDVIKAEK